MEIRPCLMVLLIGAFDGAVYQKGRIFPYKAVIEYKGNAFCAGSVIETMWILTAAKCVMNKTVSYITVRLGSRNVNDGGSLYSVKSYHIHPKYNQTTSQRDIALLKLGATVKYSASISSIALVKPGYGMEEGTRCLIPRFARNTSDIRAKLWNREKCQNAFPTSLNLTDDALCARIVPTSINGSELCSDHGFMLGSPLVCEGKQVAVVSHSVFESSALDGCELADDDAAGEAGSGLPDFFTDVAFADQWISSHTVRRRRKPGGNRRRSSGKMGRSYKLPYARNGALSVMSCHTTVMVVFALLGNLL